MLDAIAQSAAGRIVLHGTAGIGTTSVAAAFAERSRADFVDGVLYLPVSDDGGLLRSALIQLDVPSTEIPVAEADQLAAYRRKTAGRRLLVVFDGVSIADQVADLVPSSETAVVIVTARRELRRLISLGWKSFRVPELIPEDSDRLLRAMLDADVDDIDDSIVAALLGACAGHPMAIRIVGAVLIGQPDYAAQLVTEIADKGIDAFELDGERLITNILNRVYEGLLGDELRAAYHDLSANPGPDFTEDAAAVLLGVDVPAARQSLRDLIGLNLLVRGAGGRVGWHPLVHRHAKSKAAGVSTLGILTWYRDQGVAREMTVTDRPRESEAYLRIPPAAGTRADTLAWLSAERVNLERATLAAADLGYDEIARDLGLVLWTPFHLFGHTNATADAMSRALEAAERLDDRPAAVQLRSQLGSIGFAAKELAVAEELFTAVLREAEQLRHAFGQQSACEWLGKIAAAHGDHVGALAWYSRSETFVDSVPPAARPRARALLGLHRGRAYIALRRSAEAVEALVHALRHFSGTTEGDNHAKVSYELGRALLDVGDRDEARVQAQTALSLFVADRSLRRQAQTYELLAAIDDDDAHRSAAKDIYERLGDRRGGGG